MLSGTVVGTDGGGFAASAFTFGFAGDLLLCCGVSANNSAGLSVTLDLLLVGTFAGVVAAADADTLDGTTAVKPKGSNSATAADDAGTAATADDVNGIGAPNRSYCTAGAGAGVGTDGGSCDCGCDAPNGSNSTAGIDAANAGTAKPGALWN